MSDCINWHVPIRELGGIPPALAVPEVTDVRAFQIGYSRILISRDCGKWHLSISCRDRLPTWAEQVTARYRLLPDVRYMAMYLPPLTEYVNEHPYTLHWTECSAEQCNEPIRRIITPLEVR